MLTINLIVPAHKQDHLSLRLLTGLELYHARQSVANREPDETVWVRYIDALTQQEMKIEFTTIRDLRWWLLTLPEEDGSTHFST